MNDPTTRSAQEQLSDFISNHSLPIPPSASLIFDGKTRRFGEGERGREPYWYVGSKSGERISLTVGSHKDPEMKSSFHSKKPSSLKSRWKDGDMSEKWNGCESQESFPYLTRKGISSGLFGARVNYYGELVIPMYSITYGELVGLQTIKENGKKRYIKGSKKTNSYFEIQGAVENKDLIYVAEGFATAITVYMATKARVICTFDCANLPKIVKELAKKEPKTMIIIAADDDKFGETNPGRMTAEHLSKLASAIFPVFSSDESYPTDWNDLHALEGLEVVKKQIEKHSQPIKNTESSPKIEKKMNLNGASGLRRVKGSAIMELRPPANEENVLPGLLIGDVGILCAPGGYGKSGIALLIANQIASGGMPDFLGFGGLGGGAVCLLTLEDSLHVFGKRQGVIAKDLSKKQTTEHDKNLYFLDGTSCSNEINPAQIVRYIKDIVEENNVKMRLFIIDHLTYWSQIDLNDGGLVSELMKEFRAMASELGCSILLLHHSNRSGMLKGKDKPAISSTIGGSYKLHSLSRWVAFIDQPSKKELKEKFDVDGQESEYKTLCVDKVNCGKQFELLLKHKENRLGLLYRHAFATSDSSNSNSIGVYSNRDQSDSVDDALKEEAARFNMSEASPKLATIDKNSLHMMNWVTRNRVFDTISKKRRAELTETDIDGTIREKDRENLSVYKDLWVDGDTLTVSGPVCDQEDMRLFALLVNELNRFHRNGFRGLELETSLHSLIKLSKIKNSGQNYIKIQRQLFRLCRMGLDYKNSRGHRWVGPLLSYVYAIEDKGRNAAVKIGFNHFMVSFYKIQEYTFLQKGIAQSLTGHSLAFYLFFSSHKSAEMKISVDRCKRLLGITSSDKKQVRKTIKNSLDDLVKSGVMDPEKTFIKNGYVFTYRARNLH